MPQWRKLHSKITDSIDVNEMPDDFTRLLWTWLPLALDREGRGMYNPAWVKAKVMPLRMDVSYDNVQAALEWFREHEMVIIYQVKGTEYFYVPSFKTYQGNTSKEAASNFPAPPDLLQSYSGVTLDLLPERSITDSDSDSDVYADADATSDVNAKTEDEEEGGGGNLQDEFDSLFPEEKIFLTRVMTGFSERFANRIQIDTVIKMRGKYGEDKTWESLTWYAQQGVSLGEAIRRANAALPTWGQKNKPRENGQSAPSYPFPNKPSKLDIIDAAAAAVEAGGNL